MTNEEVDKLLSTPIPCGSQARDWFLPHDTERGLENVRDVVRRLVAAEREACAKVCESLFDMNDDSCDEAEKCAAAIRMRSNAVGKPTPD